MIFVKYRNHKENAGRFTTRVRRELALIGPIGEFHLMEKLSNIVLTVINKRIKE